MGMSTSHRRETFGDRLRIMIYLASSVVLSGLVGSMIGLIIAFSVIWWWKS